MRRRAPPDPLRVTRTRGTRPTCRSATGDGTRAGAPISSRHRRERRTRALFRHHQVLPDRVAADDERMGPPPGHAASAGSLVIVPSKPV
jgi:hypothetical protein